MSEAALKILLKNGLAARAPEASKAFRARRDAAYTREKEEVREREKGILLELERDEEQLLAAIEDHIVKQALSTLKRVFLENTSISLFSLVYPVSSMAIASM